MATDPQTTYWAGFINGKLHWESIDDGFGGWGVGYAKSPRIFKSRMAARKQFEDVREVKIVELK